MRDSAQGRGGRIGSAVRAGARSRIYRAAAALVLLLVVLSGFGLRQVWNNIYGDAQGRGATLSFLLAEQTTRTFQAVDLTLTGLEPAFAADPSDGRSAAFGQLLSKRVAELDLIQTLTVLDRQGRVVNSAGSDGEVLSGPAALSYIAAFEADPTLRFRVGAPLFSRPGHLSTIPVMRRLADRDGTFQGLLVASVEPKYFSDFYRALDLGRRGAIDLYQDDGRVLLASTNHDPMADAAKARAPTLNLASNVGAFTSPAFETDQHLVVIHRASGYPLLVAVGIDLSDLRLRFWRIAGPALAALALVIFLVATLAVLVRRRLEEARRARNRALTMQKLEALGQMTASVSHDFRNLLSVMTATLRLVRKRGPEEKVLRAAEEAVERGSRLISQLLAFSKRHEFDVVPSDVNDLLDELDGVLRHAAGPNVSVRLDRGEGLPLCRADQTQFDAALMNLVVNARQAMPDGGSVTISTRLRPGGVALCVADTGTGIAPADLRRVFEPFFTTKADTGTGLGLSQVYGFMRRIGGDVTVSSEVGVGTAFTLLFPLADVPRAAALDRPAA